MIIADTSGLIAAFGVDARRHRQARAVFEADPGPVILSPFVLADASIIVLADRYRTTRLLTFDERHFRAVGPLSALAFTLLPADA
jgi:predicted nucleic acid-binding protein